MILGSGAEYGWNTIKQIQGDWANLYKKNMCMNSQGRLDGHIRKVRAL